MCIKVKSRENKLCKTRPACITNSWNSCMNNVLHEWNVNNIKISSGYTTVHAVTNYLIFYTNLYSMFSMEEEWMLVVSS